MNRWNIWYQLGARLFCTAFFEEGQVRFPAAAASRICGIPAVPLLMGEGTLLAGARRAPVKIA